MYHYLLLSMIAVRLSVMYPAARGGVRNESDTQGWSHWVGVAIASYELLNNRE